MKNKVIIYGLGSSAGKYLCDIQKNYEIIAVSDGKKKYDIWNGYRFVEPNNLLKVDYDYIVVPSNKFYSEITTDLEKLGIDESKIVKGWYKGTAEFSYWNEVLTREKEFVNSHYKKIMLCLAEEENDDFWSGKVVADFGCGPRGSLSWTSTPLIKLGIDVLIPQYMEITDLSKHGVLYITATENKIPIPDEYIDYMMALEVLDRVDDIRKTIKEITRVLKSGGIFAGCFPLHELRYEDDGQPQSFDENILKLLNDNYQIISKRIAKRADYTGQNEDPYANMLKGDYVDKLDVGEKGFLWFRAVKN